MNSRGAWEEARRALKDLAGGEAERSPRNAPNPPTAPKGRKRLPLQELSSAPPGLVGFRGRPPWADAHGQTCLPAGRFSKKHVRLGVIAIPYCPAGTSPPPPEKQSGGPGPWGFVLDKTGQVLYYMISVSPYGGGLAARKGKRWRGHLKVGGFA